MDHTKAETLAGGLYVRGLVVSSSANVYQRKDGTGSFVKVQHEIATQPGIVHFEQYLDPKESKEVRIEGDKVVAYPQLPQFSQVNLRVTKYRIDRDRFIVTGAEQMPETS
jgi:hypothetical protein